MDHVKPCSQSCKLLDDSLTKLYDMEISNWCASLNLIILLYEKNNYHKHSSGALLRYNITMPENKYILLSVYFIIAIWCSNNSINFRGTLKKTWYHAGIPSRLQVSKKGCNQSGYLGYGHFLSYRLMYMASVTFAGLDIAPWVVFVGFSTTMCETFYPTWCQNNSNNKQGFLYHFKIWV